MRMGVRVNAPGLGFGVGAGIATVLVVSAAAVIAAKALASKLMDAEAQKIARDPPPMGNAADEEKEEDE